MSLHRNHIIDRLKGLGIAMVVLGHVIQMQANPSGFDQDVFFKIIYSFHMALFFVLAGMVFKLRPVKDEVILSFKRLLIPFVTFFFIVSCNFDIEVFFSRITSYFINPQLGFWFFFVLAFIRIFSSFIFTQKGLRNKLLASSLILLLGLFLIKYFAMHLVFFYFPFFFIGYFFIKTSFFEKPCFNLFQKKQNQYFLLVFLLALYLGAFPYFHRNVDNLGWPIFLIQKTLLASLGVAITYQTFTIFKFGMVDKLLEIAGRHSMYIYGLHLLFLPLYKQLGFGCVIPMLIIPIIIDNGYAFLFNQVVNCWKSWHSEHNA